MIRIYLLVSNHPKLLFQTNYLSQMGWVLLVITIFISTQMMVHCIIWHLMGRSLLLLLFHSLSPDDQMSVAYVGDVYQIFGALVNFYIFQRTRERENAGFIFAGFSNFWNSCELFGTLVHSCELLYGFSSGLNFALGNSWCFLVL